MISDYIKLEMDTWYLRCTLLCILTISQIYQLCFKNSNLGRKRALGNMIINH